MLAPLMDCEHQRQNAAVAESHDINVLELQPLQQCCRIFHHGRVAEWARDVGRSSLTHLIGCEDLMMLRKYVQLTYERVLPGVASAVQEHERRAAAAQRVIDSVAMNSGCVHRINFKGTGREISTLTGAAWPASAAA
jgi:hypothetical protein